MKKILIVIQVLAFLVFIGNISNGQIVITSGPEVTPLEMVECILEDGMIYSNVSFQGAPVSRGIFSNGQTTNLLLESGIFLTTGAGYIIPGPNDSQSATVSNGMPGNAILNSITSCTTYDASVLEFDLIPESDTLKFTYVYGTEEFPEWVGSNYRDVFGFFITGPNPAGGNYSNHNIGLIPGFEDFIDNTGGQTLQYDGFTVVLTKWLLIVPCVEYHVMIGIADCGDLTYDSGVFIAEKSISTGTEINVSKILSPSGLTEDMVEGHVEADLIFKLPGAEYAPVTICFEIGGTAINGIDYEEIDNCITFEEGEDSAIVHINPYYDGCIEGDETIKLIIENTLGCEVIYDTVEVIIKDYVEMVSQTSTGTAVCSGQSVELWVNVFNGFPPYTFEWQPGGYTNDTIVVGPEETTTYTVTYWDILGAAGTDSTTVFVFPGNQNDMMAFSFEMENNPGLPWDAVGEITGNTVFLALPAGVNMESLVASFLISNCASAYVDGTLQINGITPNDFSGLVVYEVMAQNGDIQEWTVVAEIETGMTDKIADGLILFPNPSEGKFYLETTYLESDQIELQVMELTGRIVLERKLAISETIEIDLSEQQKGMYFLRVKIREKEINRKIIMQ